MGAVAYTSSLAERDRYLSVISASKAYPIGGSSPHRAAAVEPLMKILSVQ
jgi:hypothetical protein